MLAGSFHDSTVVDELAHIPAGYAYLHYLDYRLNPEHPPVLKAISATPLLFFKELRFPTDNPFWTTIVNGEWGVGGAFLFGLHNNANAMLQWARLFPMLLTIGLILFTYFWARKLFGEWWALVPAILLGFSPIILSHGHYVTTDVAGAFGVFVGMATFVHFLTTPSLKNLFFAGLGFGLAEVMKFSAALLVPVFIILTFAFFLAMVIRDRRHALLRGFRMFGSLILIFAIGLLLVVYPIYAIFTAHYPPERQISDTTSILGYLAGGKPCCNLLQYFANLDIQATHYAITRPLAHYFLGIIMVLERITGTNVSYFLGQVSSRGSPLYFPVVYGLKESLPVLILIVLAFFFAAKRIARSIARKQWRLDRYILEHFSQFSMIVFVVTYWAWSISSPLNIGVRHLIPTIPFIYILMTDALRKRQGIGSRPNLFLGIMLAWLMLETAIVSPRYLSYFNEIGGGSANGYRYVTDSNYDWGQDLFELESWLRLHPEVDKFALDFFGGSNPAYYFGDKFVPWRSSMGNPTDSGIHWFMISINNLQNAIQPTAPGFSRDEKDSYPWLLALREKPAGMGSVPPPDYRVGTTIFIYRL
jgi:4-amino-4-deoxy-L-arabinose transferase-like glycosyltransferase